MKKQLGMLLVLSTAAVLASCGNQPTALEEAADYYYQTIKDDKTSLESYQLNSKLIIAGVSYEVSWDLYIVSGVASNVVLSDSVNENGMYDVTIKYNPDDAIAATTYQLTCTLKDAEGNTESFTVERVAPEFKFTTHEEYLKACEDKDGTIINVKGYVIGYNADPTSSGFGSIYLQDSTGGGYYAYAPVATTEKSREALEAAYPYGTEIVVSGSVTVYSGQQEFNKGCTVKKTGNTIASSELVYTNVTEVFGAAESAKDAAKLDKYQNARVQIDGARFTRMDGKYLYFTIGDGTVEFNVYSDDYMLDADEVTALNAKFTPGYEATIKGVVSVYSNTFQIYPDSLDSITITKAVITDEVACQLAVGNVEGLFAEALKTADKVDLPATDDNGVTYTYAVKSGETVALDENGDLLITQSPAETTNVLTVTCTKNGKTETKDITVTIASALPNFVTLADVIAAADGTEVAFYAEVKEVTEWSTKYNNMNATVTDGTNDLLVYRCATQVAVGDKVLVKGTVDSYNNAKQIAQGSTVVKFDAETLTTVKAASEAEDGTAVTFVALVTEIVSEWSEQYGNISVNVKGEDGTVYYVYRLSTNVKVGDFVVVTGTTGSYKGAKQLAQGGTAVVLGAEETPAE